jgi:hypothetical protein
MRSIGSPFMDKGRLKALLKNRLLKGWGITQLEHKPAKNNDRVANRTLTFKRTLLKLGLVESPRRDKMKTGI